MHKETVDFPERHGADDWRVSVFRQDEVINDMVYLRWGDPHVTMAFTSRKSSTTTGCGKLPGGPISIDKH